MAFPLSVFGFRIIYLNLGGYVATLEAKFVGMVAYSTQSDHIRIASPRHRVDWKENHKMCRAPH